MTKRIMDIMVSTFLLVATAPIVLLAAVLIGVTSGLPILYLQKRPGKGGKPFGLIKFRTMTDGPGLDAQRLTWIGKVLRKSSIDELPELINVVCGDMSLVGPRPLLMEYLPLYTAEQNRRHDVRPGITGWAQVNGRNVLSWERKFELDVWYVDNQSFLLDAKILCLTVIKVLKAEGINQPGSATAKPFRGTLVEGCRRENG